MGSTPTPAQLSKLYPVFGKTLREAGNSKVNQYQKEITELKRYPETIVGNKWN